MDPQNTIIINLLKLCPEVQSRIAYFTATPNIPDTRLLGNPFDYAHLFSSNDEIQKEIANSQKGLWSLSLQSHGWHNAAQPFLPSAIVFSSRNADTWNTVYKKLNNRKPLYAKITVYPHRFFNVKYANKENALKTSVNHLYHITFLKVDITSRVSSIHLRGLKNHFLRDAINLETLIVFASHVHSVEDYRELLNTFLFHIGSLKTLVWVTSQRDDSNVFYRLLVKGQNLTRLNMKVPANIVPVKDHLQGSLPKLQCLDVDTVDENLGNHYNLLAKFDLPNFHTLVCRDFVNADGLRQLLANHSMKIKNLSLKATSINYEIFRSCEQLENFYMDMRYAPYATNPGHGAHPKFSHPNLKKIIISKFVDPNYDFNHLILYRLSNNHFFPCLEQIQILDFKTEIFNIKTHDESWAQETRQWIEVCRLHDRRVTDRNGNDLVIIDSLELAKSEKFLFDL